MDDTYVLVVWDESGSFLGTPPIPPIPGLALAELLAQKLRQAPEAQGKLIDVITLREYEFSLCPVHQGQQLP